MGGHCRDRRPELDWSGERDLHPLLFLLATALPTTAISLVGLEVSQARPAETTPQTTRMNEVRVSYS
jgi:hypothetical protein